jgi:hypothetical protein
MPVRLENLWLGFRKAIKIFTTEAQGHRAKIGAAAWTLQLCVLRGSVVK